MCLLISGVCDDELEGACSLFIGSILRAATWSKLGVDFDRTAGGNVGVFTVGFVMAAVSSG